MKTSKLKNVAWVIIALVLTSATVLAQNRGNRNARNMEQHENCLYAISDLSEKQQEQITAMDKQHHEKMDQLRTKRRSTPNAIEKSEIRTEMLKNVEAHRDAVKATLNAAQQKQYEQIHAYGNSGGKGQFTRGRTYGNYSIRGNRNGYAMHGNKATFRNSRTNNSFRNGNRGHNYRRTNRLDSCLHTSSNHSDEGFEVIEESNF